VDNAAKVPRYDNVTVNTTYTDKKTGEEVVSNDVAQVTILRIFKIKMN